MTAPLMRIRALIVEDEPLARRTLREILVDVPWIECVGEADNGARAVETVSYTHLTLPTN